MKNVTIKTIAEACGVSIGTVDRALNNRGRINLATQRLIMDTAQKLGYKKNRFASVLSKQANFRIAVVSPCTPIYFFQFIEDGIHKAQKDMADYGFIIDQYHTCFLNYEEQIETLRLIDKTKYDGLVLDASSDALSPILNEFIDAGIPVVTFNSDAVSSNRTLFVGENGYTSGCLCGLLMGRMLNGTGKVAVLINYMALGSPYERYQGFIDTLQKDFPNIEILEPAICKESEELATKYLHEEFTKANTPSGVFANSASGTVAMGRFFSNYSIKNKPIVIGYDVTPEVVNYLLNGICDVVIDQNPLQQSYQGVKLLCKHLMEGWCPSTKEKEIRVKVVTKVNVNDYLENPDEEGRILF